jgi:hypothetical protein
MSLTLCSYIDSDFTPHSELIRRTQQTRSSSSVPNALPTCLLRSGYQWSLRLFHLIHLNY